MQRLNTLLSHLCIKARENQTEAEAEQHNVRVKQLIDVVASATLIPAPPHLHNAGDRIIREVTATDIDNLRSGRRIAMATRVLLKTGAGNQRLAIAASNGDSQLAASGIRKLGLSDQVNPGEAALAVLSGSGLCSEHASVASALARQQNIPVVRVAVEWEDHGAALLHPERGNNAIVVDAWTTIPSSCLKADSMFADVDVTASSKPISTSAPSSGEATATTTITTKKLTSRMFNLVTLDALRERLAQQLGSDPIKQAMQDTFLAERRATWQGDPKPRWVATLPDAVYDEAANYLSDNASCHVAICPVDANGNARITPRPSTLFDAASLTVLRHTAIANSRPLSQWMAYQAEKLALQPPQHAVTLRRVHTEWATAGNGVRAVISVEHKITRRPFLRDMRLPSKNILYRAASGDTFSTIDTEQSVIDTGVRGLERAQRAGFPERYVAVVEPSPALAAALAEYALKRLQSRQTPVSTFALNTATHTDLQLLNDALAHLPQCDVDIAMQRFSHLLPQLHPTQIEEGVQVWKTHWRRISDGPPLMDAAAAVIDGWARHFDDATIEPYLRDALLLTQSPARLVDALTQHVLIVPSMQQRALEMIDATLADIPAGEMRNNLLRPIRQEVIRIRDASLRAAGLAMVARYA